MSGRPSGPLDLSHFFSLRLECILRSTDFCHNDHTLLCLTLFTVPPLSAFITAKFESVGPSRPNTYNLDACYVLGPLAEAVIGPAIALRRRCPWPGPATELEALLFQKGL